jgi:3-methylfumaryl-CoA hydratase
LSGLHFVTVRTEISQRGQVVITEDQDLVYREPGPPASARSAEFKPPSDGHRDRVVHVDPGLVVHGPLQALLMAELARPQVAAQCEYSYRLVAPLFDGQGLVVSAAPDAAAVRVSCRDAADRVTASGVIRPG